MKIDVLIEEISEFMQLDEQFKLDEELGEYSEWDSMVILSVLALFDDEFDVDASDKISECITFQNVIDIVSDRLEA